MKLNNLEKIKKAIHSNSISILYVKANNCSVCESLFPKIEELISNYSQIKLISVKFNELDNSI